MLRGRDFRVVLCAVVVAIFLVSGTSSHVGIASSACRGTLYPQLCISTVSTLFQDLKCKRPPLSNIVSATINHTLAEVKKSHSESRKYEYSLLRKRQLDARDRTALDDCLELLDQTATELKTSFSDVLSEKRIPDAQALLSAALTNQQTCLDGFAYSNKQTLRNYFKGSLYNISRHVSNSLAMVSKMPGADKPSSGNLYGMTTAEEDGFPRWMNGKDRMLLQTANSTNTSASVKYDLIVSKDGSGNFSTINEALAMAPNSSSTRFVIYIKAGAYYEYVEVIKKKTNIMFLGDGIGKTLIKGNRSVVDGWTTFRSATLG
uniref:Pectinesterase inhibitor domain-containing protein n=1 Tax=Kalanchoe fedtschenkoi TaxID=63787 RepID=A0A7N0UGE1_KALFE